MRHFLSLLSYTLSLVWCILFLLYRVISMCRLMISLWIVSFSVNFVSFSNSVNILQLCSDRSHFFSRVQAILQPALSVGRLIGRSVTLYFFYDFISLTSLLLPKWSGDLKYGPCPPARDFGSRVSGFVSFSMQS